MDRAKGFVHNLGEYILEQMVKHEKTLTPDKVTFIAAMCEDYNEICECIAYMCDHKDGSLYHMLHDGGMGMTHDGVKAHEIHGSVTTHDGIPWSDGSGRRRR